VKLYALDAVFTEESDLFIETVEFGVHRPEAYNGPAIIVYFNHFFIYAGDLRGLCGHGLVHGKRDPVPLHEINEPSEGAVAVVSDPGFFGKHVTALPGDIIREKMRVEID
jgi:hypothetical protein